MDALSTLPPATTAIDERAARFARVLASDMLIYNKDAVEQGRESGSLLQTMAGEIADYVETEL